MGCDRGPVLRLAIQVVALSVALGCAGPSVEVQARPATSQILVDGRQRGTGIARFAQPYYGTMRLEVVPPPPPGGRGLRVAERMLVLDEPASPWLFPFDLLVEVSTAPWRSDVTEVELDPVRVPELESGAHPKQAPALRAHALGFRTAR